MNRLRRARAVIRWHLARFLIRRGLRMLGLDPARVVMFTRHEWTPAGVREFILAAINADARELPGGYAIPAELADDGQA